MKIRNVRKKLDAVASKHHALVIHSATQACYPEYYSKMQNRNQKRTQKLLAVASKHLALVIHSATQACYPEYYSKMQTEIRNVRKK